jgi:hypothetical protein
MSARTVEKYGCDWPDVFTQSSTAVWYFSEWITGKHVHLGELCDSNINSAVWVHDIASLFRKLDLIIWKSDQES